MICNQEKAAYMAVDLQQNVRWVVRMEIGTAMSVEFKLEE